MKKLLLLLCCAAPAWGQDITLAGGAKDAAQVVVTATIKGPKKLGYIALKDADGGGTYPAQFIALAADSATVRFVVPALDKGRKINLSFQSVQPGAGANQPPAFNFKQDEGKHVDLLFGDRPVLRFMNAAHDTSSKDAHELTFKPFHHVFDPVDGKATLTNGAGLASDKALLFPHHRGLFYAFNKINTGDKAESDLWHGRNGEYTAFAGMKVTEAGTVFGAHTAKLSWHGRDGTAFATEERTLTAYNAAGGSLIDFESTVATTRPKVKLDGDPQHAGFHFRAAMEVAQKTKGQTYYVRPDGADKPGATRNWEPKTKKGPENLPWDAMSFVLGTQRYTVLRVVHPDNPKPNRGSERDYGRFGDYFEYELTPQKPLTVKYRVWVQRGELTVAQCEAIAAGFVQPPAVKAQ